MPVETSKKNAEGYHDTTAAYAMEKISAEERRSAKRSFRPLAYICSPYRGNVSVNEENARKYCRFAVESGYIPIAPHLFFPQFMDDNNPAERDAAMFMDFVLMGKCHEVWVFGSVISNGMASEIGLAKKRNQKIRCFDTDMREVL